MVFSVTFNNFSVKYWGGEGSVLLVEGTREYHRPVESH